VQHQRDHMAKSDTTCIYRESAFRESELLNGLISSGPNENLRLGRENIESVLKEAVLGRDISVQYNRFVPKQLIDIIASNF